MQNLEINVQSFIPNDKTLDIILTPPKNIEKCESKEIDITC